MRKRAIVVHLNALVRVTPLVGGYLKAFAYRDPEIRRSWDIELYSRYVRTPASEIICDLATRRPDVVAFSVYTWNVGLVMRLLRALRGVLPPATEFLLGGVEVMHGAPALLDRSWENVTVCNGEGEQTFADFLIEAQSAAPDPTRVRGTSYARDGQWHATEDLPRIRDLSAIPSPWLEGMFSEHDTGEVALFETNRGCPFACEFCYWGGAIGQRVNRLELARIKDELTYIAHRKTKSIAICDANFGMLRQDLEIARHIAQLHERHKAPSRVLYSSAKNNPDRVEQVAHIFNDAGLLHNQAISLQTLNDRALRLAKRDNIKKETYLRLQQRLNEWEVPSFIELIWPMPGETLDSFKDGVSELCAMGAQSFTIYPLLWLRNVGYAGHTDDYGVATLQEDDSASGGRVVIKTDQVSFEEYLEGLLYGLSVYLLHDCRGLYATMLVLDALGIASFREVFERFSAMMSRADDANAISRRWHEGSSHFEELIKYVWRGTLAYSALHGDRGDFDQVLEAFVDGQPEWTDGEEARVVRAALEFDLLARPLPYLQTSLSVATDFRQIEVLERGRARCTVVSPYNFPRLVRNHRRGAGIGRDDIRPEAVQITIDHRAGQTFKLPGKTDEEHYWHMHQVVREVNRLEPSYEVGVWHRSGPRNDNAAGSSTSSA